MPWQTILSFFELGQNAVDSVGKWFAGIGGQIASAIEAGFLALFKDLWDVIIGPLEIMVGAVIILFGLSFAFKDEMMSLAPLLAMIK